MKPVLLSFGSYTITTLGVFLVLAFILSLFVIWRIISRFEVDKEKTIDLFLLTSIVSLLGARVYFILINPPLLSNPLNLFLINRYPGFSFWGGLLAGLIFLYFISPRLKVNFWQIADFAIVGVFLGIAVTSLGCLFNSCQYGLVSTLPIAVSQVGLVGKRFPLQILESLTFFIGFLYLWNQVLKFHFNGSILIKGLIFLSIFKFILEFFRGDGQNFYGLINLGHVWALVSFIFALTIYYHLTRRSFLEDLRSLPKYILNPQKRRQVLTRIYKSWYNFLVDLRVSFIRLKRKVFKGLNLKSNPNQF